MAPLSLHAAVYATTSVVNPLVEVIMRWQDHKGCFTRRERDVSYPLNPLNQPIVNSLYRIVFLTEGSNTAQFNKSINSQYAHHKQVRAADNEHIPPTAQVTGLTYFQQLTAPPIR